jgi:hypothetical protein
MTGSFDPSSFLNSTFTEANATQSEPVPVGEYQAVVEKVEANTWQSRDGTKSGLKLDVTWNVDDAGVKAAMGRDKVSVRQGIMLDLNEQGGLDMGKGRNVTLGRLRDATGLNVNGQPFSPTMLVGKVAKISVSQRPDGEAIYNDVKGVARLS